LKNQKTKGGSTMDSTAVQPENWTPEKEHEFQAWCQGGTPGLYLACQWDARRPAPETIDAAVRRFFDYLLDQVTTDTRPVADFVRWNLDDGFPDSLTKLGAVDRAAYCGADCWEEMCDFIDSSPMTARLWPFKFLRWLCSRKA
jgi:hypothetical protein